MSSAVETSLILPRLENIERFLDFARNDIRFERPLLSALLLGGFLHRLTVVVRRAIVFFERLRHPFPQLLNARAV